VAKAREVTDRCPRSGILHVAAKLLKSETPVRAREHVYTAVVLRVFDALHHNP
jgi:hypothetical protein